MIYYCQLHKKFDADGIHNIPNKLIRYYCITLFLIKVNDIIEILKYVYMGILSLIVEIDMILFSKTNEIECLKRDVYDVMYMLCTHVMIVANS